MIPGIQNRDGQFSHTGVGSPQWWMVNLGKVFYVYRVRLWNRLGYGKLQIGGKLHTNFGKIVLPVGAALRKSFSVLVLS